MYTLHRHAKVNIRMNLIAEVREARSRPMVIVVGSTVRVGVPVGLIGVYLIHYRSRVGFESTSII